MDLYQWYFLAGVLLLIAEIIVPGFILAPIGVAALAAGLLALFVDFVWAHLLLFAFVAVGIFSLLPKWNKLNLAQPIGKADIGLLGRVGTVIEKCTDPLKPGRIQIFGDSWEILWSDDQQELTWLKSLEPGARVQVVEVIGNKVKVTKHDAQHPG